MRASTDRWRGEDKRVPLQDLLNIARTTLSSKILTHDKDHFAALAVDAVLRLRGSGDLEAINILKKPGGTLRARPPGPPAISLCSHAHR
jgi:chaperonin GroEL (HSP60 family)